MPSPISGAHSYGFMRAAVSRPLRDLVRAAGTWVCRDGMELAPVELAVFAASAVAIAALSRLACRAVFPRAAFPWQAEADETEALTGEGRRQSLRLQVSTALHSPSAIMGVDEFEDMVMELTPDVRTVGDVKKALVASLSDSPDAVSDHREVLVHCLDEERDLLVVLPSHTPLSALANVEELIVTERASATAAVAGQHAFGGREVNPASIPPPGLLAQRKAALLAASSLYGSRGNGTSGRRHPARGDEESAGSGSYQHLPPSKPPTAATLGSMPRHIQTNIARTRETNAPRASSELEAKLERRRVAAESTPALPPPGRMPQCAPPPPPPPPPPQVGASSHSALMSELASRTSSGNLLSAVRNASPDLQARAAPSRSGSFLDSPEFTQKLERRKQLAESQPSPKHATGGGAAETGTDAGGMSYLDMLAERIAARQSGVQ